MTLFQVAINQCFKQFWLRPQSVSPERYECETPTKLHQFVVHTFKNSKSNLLTICDTFLGILRIQFLKRYCQTFDLNFLMTPATTATAPHRQFRISPIWPDSNPIAHRDEISHSGKSLTSTYTSSKVTPSKLRARESIVVVFISVIYCSGAVLWAPHS